MHAMLKPVKNRQSDALARVSWQDFERLLADHYRDLGYQVEHHGTGSSGARSDGGIDLKLRKADEYVLVQCKRWNAMQVPHNDVHQLMGIMDNEDATGAILVTSGEFTAAAIQAAGKKGRVQLVDGAALRAMLGSRLPPDPPGSAPTGVGSQNDWANARVSDTHRRRRSRDQASSGGTEKLMLAGAGVVFMLLLFYIAYRLMQGAMDTLSANTRPAQVQVLPEVRAAADVAATSEPRPASLQRAGEPNALRTVAGAMVGNVTAATGNQDAARQVFDATHRDFLRGAKIADPRYPVNRESARIAAKNVAGVRSAVWLDRENLLLIVERNEQRTQQTIDRVCLKLQPLGDTLGVVVNLQSGAARTGDELAVLSRNCQLAVGDRAFMQTPRQVDVVSPEIRAQHRANNRAADDRAAASTAESMKILEATTPALKD